MDDVDKGIQALEEWKKACPLRKFRTQRGISQGLLAGMIGASAGAVGHWENGLFKPDPSHVVALRTKLGDAGPKLVEDFLAWSDRKPTMASESA